MALQAFARLLQKESLMKFQWIALSALALSFTFTSPVFAGGKVSKKEMKAFQQSCKSENPNASKKEIRKCVKEKAKAAKA